MPWYQEADEPRLWIAYVDAEHTLNGFETFLNQYRPLLGAVPSGVTYVAPNAWRGAVQRAFGKVIVRGAQRDPDAGTFLTYCQRRHKVETQQWGALPVADLQTYGALHARFSTTSFEALYQRWRESTHKAVSSSDVDAAARLDCVLQVYALGTRYRSGPADGGGPR